MSKAQLAQTQFAIINNNKIAYRQFGNGNPLFIANRFRGIMDTWDPLFLDNLAKNNTVIIFDYPGIGNSEGELPLTMIDIAEVIPQLADQLEIEKFNIMGWSYGGLVAQTVTFQHPDRILKTILIGTNPPGENKTPINPIFFEHALKPLISLEDEYYLFFEPTSQKSKKAAQEYHNRINQKLDSTLIPATEEIFNRYFSAVDTFQQDKLNFREMYKTLKTPLLIISGDNDISFATENWFPLLKNAPTMQHIIFNDAGHAPQHQYPELIAGYVNVFLT